MIRGVLIIFKKHTCIRFSSTTFVGSATSIPLLQKGPMASMGVHACNLNTWEAEAIRPRVQSQPWLQSQFEVAWDRQDYLTNWEGQPGKYYIINYKRHLD